MREKKRAATHSDGIVAGLDIQTLAKTAKKKRKYDLQRQAAH
jgi:hypothetical protein